MGQKVNPVGMRIGIIRSWDSKWYANKKEVPALVKEDFVIREFLNKTYKKASIARIEIDRKGNDSVTATIFTAKPGIVLGREKETINKAIAKLTKLTSKAIKINVREVRFPERIAILVAQSIADQLENRASFRRAQKIAMQRALKAGAKGCRTLVSGRLGGAEMARSEGYSEGRVPLHTFRADIDYATAEAHTTYGILGIKVWIYNGEVLPGQTREDNLKKFDDDRRKPPFNNNRPPRKPRENQNKKGGN